MNKRIVANFIKSMPRCADHLINYRIRCNGGGADLTKSYKNSKPISDKQESEIRRFWKPYLNTWKARYAFDIRWFDVYNRTNVFGADLAAYIPDGYYYAIVDKSLTNGLYADTMDDKNLYDLYFPDVNQPATVIRKVRGVYLDAGYNIVSESEAVDKCVNNKNVVIKPSVNSSQGKGIVFWREDDGVQSLRKALSENSSVVVQDLITQHDFMASFTDSCVNTMRIVTLLWDSEISITSSVLIMGGATAKTNHLHGGGIVCGILPDGRLREIAFDGNLNEYRRHPNGIVFADAKIPNYDRCVALVKKLAPRMSGVSKLLNWDITLDQNGEPLLIEVNLTWGGSVQIAAGPAFGDKTEEILDYVTRTGVWK